MITIKGFKKYIRRRYIMTKTKQDISIVDLFVEEINNSSNDDWDELCNECSSLIKKAKMTNKDIDVIVKSSKKD